MRWISSIIILLCLLAQTGTAQPLYKVEMPKVGGNGYYSIDLPYTVRGIARPDLSDIRILDAQGMEVPWLLRANIDAKNSNELIPLPMKVSSLPRRTDVLVTTSGEPLSSFVLKVKNADVEKEAALLGSNDGTKWFAVKDRFMLNRMSSATDTELWLDLTFPLSDYKFYKLSLNDSLSAPLNIVGAIRVESESYSRQCLLDVPLQSVRIVTKEKKTEIELVLPHKYEVEQLDFYISSPRYYQRNIELLSPLQGVFSSVLSDKKGVPQSLALHEYSDTLRFSVANGDDRPLGIDSVKVLIRMYSLIADLKKDEQYTLTLGDPKAQSPQYDLSFSSRVPDKIDHIILSNSEVILQQITSAPTEEPSPWIVFLKAYGIWIVIVVVIIQILYMVRRMIK